MRTPTAATPGSSPASRRWRPGPRRLGSGAAHRNRTPEPARGPRRSVRQPLGDHDEPATDGEVARRPRSSQGCGRGRRPLPAQRPPNRAIGPSRREEATAESRHNQRGFAPITMRRSARSRWTDLTVHGGRNTQCSTAPNASARASLRIGPFSASPHMKSPGKSGAY